MPPKVSFVCLLVATLLASASSVDAQKSRQLLESAPLAPTSSGADGRLFEILPADQTGLRHQYELVEDHELRRLYTTGFFTGAPCLGDLDGDGIVDMVVGAPYDDDGGSSRGAVYVLFLNADGTVKSEQKISDTIGGFGGTLDDNDFFGIGLDAIGDLDGDGNAELIVGANGDDDAGAARGAVYVLFLNADGTVKAEQKISSTSGGPTRPPDDSDTLGWARGGLGEQIGRAAWRGRG